MKAKRNQTQWSKLWNSNTPLDSGGPIMDKTDTPIHQEFHWQVHCEECHYEVTGGAETKGKALDDAYYAVNARDESWNEGVLDDCPCNLNIEITTTEIYE